MKLYLVRHGETDWNKIHKLQGKSNVPLNEYGRELARVTSKAMEDIEFTHIFSSPLDRAYETAEILRGSRDLEIVVDKRLEEMSFGIYEGVPNEEVKEGVDMFFNDPANYIPPEGGETYQEVCQRTQSFVEEVLIPLSEREPDAQVLLTAHGALNKTIIIYLKHLEIKNMWDGAFQKNCCVNIFDINGYDFKLIEEAKVYY